MIRPADIREWRNQDVVDEKQRRIGMLEAVYVDTATDEPAMATVRTGLPTRHRLVFVPLDGAVLGPGYVRVSYTKGRVRRERRTTVDSVTIRAVAIRPRTANEQVRPPASP
ncbi:PRC-barrel domain-containing protein [Streptomyces neyagawaensis]|uniref:PRC-barrel domain-containing protein n=1 Tax=Streptomyces neyagawaensis TaxID=42238 RepID=UPI00099F20C4|nr:PRC-barrel domain-containing protein [Streptomyces neyagawaensis]MCL6736102.1 PRC-barrel domain-containing protein [Streptomyces neyagawaensis]MDE1684076.1 PRC-barrel domain-containing protein [Streptomyces neyagawaensis]